MALRDDIHAISVASERALHLLTLADNDTVFSNIDGIQDNDTSIELTPAQKLKWVNRVGPLITIIKNRAAQLP